ncbi:MAG: hypothetical protein GTO22_06750 [Gemmatimonadales bacterium]|nr:hypothetical protein [Gemmatimonadales bacterium]
MNPDILYCENCCTWGFRVELNGRICEVHLPDVRYKAVRTAICANCKGWIYRLFTW